MDKIIHILADGSTVDYFPQSYTDEAVAAALAAAGNQTSEVPKDVIIENTDGTSEKMVPETPAA